MAYDEQLSEQFRNALGDRDGLSEKKMMGGVCFMINGNMIGGADRINDDSDTGQGRFMFRVGKENDAVGAKLPGARPMNQGGRRMSGFFHVNEEDCGPSVMAQWIDLALGFASTLPSK